MKKIILFISALILIVFLSIIFIVNSNKSYNNNMLNEIKKKYSDKANYVNKYANKYIVKTNNKVVVLNEEFQEITSEEINNIKEKDLDLVYRKNSIMYQKNSKKGRTNIYTYYDIKTGEEIDKLEIEG